MLEFSPQAAAPESPQCPEIVADLPDPSCYHLLFDMESSNINHLVLIPLGLARAIARTLEDAGFLGMRAR